MNHKGTDSVRNLSVDDYVSGVLSGDRSRLARAITLIESTHKESDPVAREVLQKLLPSSGGSHRIGITGVPGVGKSTLIEAFGNFLIDQEHRVAVLAVDPTSTISGGSILGDKSRMPTLANNPSAFVRPSPNALSPGGVGRRTREAQILCEAAGYDVVLVETVGVGQSEIIVSEMVDTFVTIMLPGAGDELQGIKKGVLELADLIVVNKADGDNRKRALAAKRDFDAALRYLKPRTDGWLPRVEIVSALQREGIEELWTGIRNHYEFLRSSGEIVTRRKRQRKQWMWSLIGERLQDHFKNNRDVRAHLAKIESEVLEGSIIAADGVRQLMEIYDARLQDDRAAED